MTNQSFNPIDMVNSLNQALAATWPQAHTLSREEFKLKVQALSGVLHF